MDSNLEDLAQSVEQKYGMLAAALDPILTRSRKQAVTSQSQELETLEAKLKDTEERLRQRQSLPASKAVDGSNASHRRTPLGDTFSDQKNDRSKASASSPLATQPPNPSSISPSTMSHWRPAPAQNEASTMSSNTSYGDVGQVGKSQDRRYAE